MTVVEFLKKHATLPAVLLSSCLSADTPLGIIGGSNGGAPYVSLVAPSGAMIPIDLGFPTGAVNSVAITATGSAALIGGVNTAVGGVDAFLYISSYEGDGPLLIPTNSINAAINSVAINASIYGIMGGTTTGGTVPYAVTVSSSGITTALTVGFATGRITSVAVNDSGLGLIGGGNGAGTVSYAALVSPSGVASSNLLSQTGVITAVALNASGQGLIGGGFAVNPAAGAMFAAFVSPFGVVSPLSIGLQGLVRAVAINTSGQSIIGAERAASVGPAYAALVSPSGAVTPIATGLLQPGGFIASAAINDFGQAIIGGRDGPTTNPFPAYAALVSPSGDVTTIATGITNGTINSVAINSFGQGLIGGVNSTTSQAYAAIVSPFGVATPLSPVAATNIFSVAMTQLPAQIPTSSLNGNNLKFADYINKNAPQDVFYFIPAMFDGTLAEALKSAAPTRNAISLYTASNNLFYLNSSLADHLRNVSRFRSRPLPSKPAPVSIAAMDWNPEELTASLSEKKVAPDQAEPGYCFNQWFDVIGAWSHHESQQQTVGFEPATGAIILGFEGVIDQNGCAGASAAYSYTHVDEQHSAGHSNINQGYLSIYGSYTSSYFYWDGALWGGLFHIEQVRNIRMTGFEFKAHSDPSGWQLAPHMEFGGMYRDRMIAFDPFIMIDWVSSWQKRFREKGSGPFKVEQKEHYSSLLRTEVGMRFYQTIPFNAWRLSFEEKASYVYKHPFHIGRMQAFLVGSPGSFTVETLSASQNLGVAELGIIFESTNPRGPYGAISYQGEFGSASQSQQVSFELAWNF